MKEAEIDELFEKYFKDKKVYGTSEMTEEERTRIKNIKQEYGLQEYE